MSESNDTSDAEIAHMLWGAPKWITPEWIQRTLATLQPYYKEKLTVQDALEILNNMDQLFRLLSEKGSTELDSSLNQNIPAPNR